MSNEREEVKPTSNKNDDSVKSTGNDDAQQSNITSIKDARQKKDSERKRTVTEINAFNKKMMDIIISEYNARFGQIILGGEARYLFAPQGWADRGKHKNNLLIISERALKALTAHEKTLYFKTSTQMTADKPGYYSKLQLWLENERRQQFQGMDMDCSTDAVKTSSGAYNCWTGINVSKAYTHPNDCRKFMQLLDGICDDKEVKEYVLNWMAFQVQFPWKQIRTALLFKGPPGTGKDTIMNYFGLIFGPWGYVNCDQPDTILGDFNDIIWGKKIIVINEIDGLNKKQRGKLNGLIANRETSFQKKYFGAETIKNQMGIALASNSELPFTITDDERRLVIIQTGIKYLNKEKFCAEVELEGKHEVENKGKNKGAAALYALLDGRDLDNFNPVKDRPLTQERAEMVENSLDYYGIEQWLFDCFDSGIFFGLSTSPLPREEHEATKTDPSKYGIWNEDKQTYLTNPEITHSYKMWVKDRPGRPANNPLRMPEIGKRLTKMGIREHRFNNKRGRWFPARTDESMQMIRRKLRISSEQIPLPPSD